MISRVADHCFWFGRYVERAEATARMLAATSSLALDAELPAAACWRPLLVVAGEEAAYRDRACGGSDDHAAWGDGDRVADFLTWQRDIGVSLVRSIDAARWNARSIREVLSHDAWESVNELYLWMQSADARAQWDGARDDFYRQVRRGTQLCLGLLRSTMLHDEPLEFIWLGVMLERISQTARILDVHHHAYAQSEKQHEVVATALWLSLLRALSGSEAFVKRFGSRVDAEHVAEFLLYEPDFPRSIAFCVHAALDRLNRLRPASQPGLPGAGAHDKMRALVAWIDGAGAPTQSQSQSQSAGGQQQEQTQPTALADLPSVHDVLTRVVDETHAIGGALAAELFGG